VELHFKAVELATGAQTYSNLGHFPHRNGTRCLLLTQLGDTSLVES